MLVKLLPNQISERWDLIKFAIQESTPEITEYGIVVILENLLCDIMQCWLEVEERDGTIKLLGVVVTSVYTDSFFQQNVLRICVLYTYTDLPMHIWGASLESLRNYARGRECYKIEAYTDRAEFEALIKHLGGKFAYHLSLEV